MIPSRRCNIGRSGRLVRGVAGTLVSTVVFILGASTPVAYRSAQNILVGFFFLFLGILGVMEGISGFCVLKAFLGKVQDDHNSAPKQDKRYAKRYSLRLVYFALLVSIVFTALTFLS